MLQLSCWQLKIAFVGICLVLITRCNVAQINCGERARACYSTVFFTSIPLKAVVDSESALFPFTGAVTVTLALTPAMSLDMYSDLNTE